MRIQIRHQTSYTYDDPPKSVIQTLHLTPRHHDGQYVVRWRISLAHDGRLDQREDAFGNLVHAFTLAGPVEGIGIDVEGEVETQDTAGVVRGAVERFPPGFYLRETSLTEPDEAIKDLAAEIDRGGGSALDRMHRLLGTLNTTMTFDPDPTQVHTTAAQAYAIKRGVCQDLSHIFSSVARTLEIPARYVSGHMYRVDGVTDLVAGHAWVEVFVPELGWVAFDPTNGICATDAHVRIAVGLDYLGAAPVRGSRQGGSHERMTVNVRVAQAQSQSQSQSQSQQQT